MTRAVIFDIDGTLVDSVDLHAEAWQRAFQDFGKTTDFKTVRDQIGKGSDKLLPVFLSEAEVQEMGKQIQQHREEIFHRDYMDKIKPFPSVPELLRKIQDSGKKVALASSAKGPDLAHYKELLQIEDLLNAETSSDDASSSKPDPDIFQAALKQLGKIACDEVVVVGDTPHDAEAAGKAGIIAIGLLCGGVGEPTLRNAGCKQIFRDPAHLLARYDESLIMTAEGMMSAEKR